MAWQLSHEVTHATRVRLTGAEFKVLAVIAEECRDPETRTCTLDRAVIAKRAHLSLDGVRRAVRSLAAKGYDPRVPIPGMYDSCVPPRPVYAFPGRPCTYRLPVLVDEPIEPPKPTRKGGGRRPPKGGGKTPPPPTRAEVGAARAAVVADCTVCDEFGYVPSPSGKGIVNHHPRADVDTSLRHDV